MMVGHADRSVPETNSALRGSSPVDFGMTDTVFQSVFPMCCVAFDWSSRDWMSKRVVPIRECKTIPGEESNSYVIASVAVLSDLNGKQIKHRLFAINYCNL